MLSRKLPAVLASATVGAVLGGCSLLQQIAALRHVDFAVDRVTDARLAGVGLDRVQNYQDLTAIDIARIGAALAAGQLPFDFVLHLSALNPADNNVTARLLQMDWTLLLDDRETVSGRTDREILLQPGVVADIPIVMGLDLADFFQQNARELVNLALAAAGRQGEPTRIALRATPTIQTSMGPIRYPEPITIVSREIGGRADRPD